MTDDYVSPNAKLTAEQVRAIRERYANGEGSHQSLADEYDVTSHSIALLLNRKTYRGVK